MFNLMQRFNHNQSNTIIIIAIVSHGIHTSYHPSPSFSSIAACVFFFLLLVDLPCSRGLIAANGYSAVVSSGPLASAMEDLASTTALPSTNATAGATARAEQVAAAERKPRPHREQALHCPRCNSGNTKFCYYNNYSLTQPRYFCKACRRYWTQGGSLRNVPVGGGSRKNKKSSLSRSSAAAPSNSSPAVDLMPPPHSSRGFGAFMPIPSSDSEYPTGLGALVQEFSQPTLSFPLAVGGGGGCSSGYGSFGARVDQLICGGGGGQLLLPFGDAKPAAVPSSISTVGEQFEQNKRQVIVGDPPVFWNGNYIIGGGSWLS